MSSSLLQETLQTNGEFISRHIGPSLDEQDSMLRVLGFKSRDDLIQSVVPTSIRENQVLPLAEFTQALSEVEALNQLKSIANKNLVYKSWIGQGYYNTFTPAVIQRNILENPSWYTAYTPYQPEISQGRLEAIINFQQMIMDLSGMDIANASMLDEGTAAAEAMTLALRSTESQSTSFFVILSIISFVMIALLSRTRRTGLVKRPPSLHTRISRVL